jgi:hypothetical protein
MNNHTSEQKVKALLESFRAELSKSIGENLVIDGEELEYFILEKQKPVINIEFAHPNDSEILSHLVEGQKFVIIIMVMEDRFFKQTFSLRTHLEKLCKELFGKDFDRIIIKN